MNANQKWPSYCETYEMNFHRRWKGDDGIYFGYRFWFHCLYEQNGHFLEAFFTPMPFLKYDALWSKSFFINPLMPTVPFLGRITHFSGCVWSELLWLSCFVWIKGDHLHTGIVFVWVVSLLSSSGARHLHKSLAPATPKWLTKEGMDVLSRWCTFLMNTKNRKWR